MGRPSRRRLAAKGFRPVFLLPGGFAAAILPVWLLALAGLVCPDAYLDTTYWHAHEPEQAAALLLRRGHLDDEDAETAGRIISSSHRITRMITQTLDLTRARLGGGLPIEAKPTDLREVCRNVVDEFDATIKLEVEGDVTGTWDADRLTEVLSNIVGNAIAYAAPETVVAVKAHADGADVVVEISNQGDPLPADLLPFIFEPFRRAKPRAKSATGNLGLGLYIAHQIVLSHGGTLVASCADGTTTFVMRLPRGAPER